MRVTMIMLQMATATFAGAQMRAAAQMEAQMESRVVAEHTARLESFGMSFKGDGAVTPPPDVEPPKGPEDPEAPAQPVTPPESQHSIYTLLHFVSFAFLLKAGAITSSVMLTLSPLRAVHTMQSSKSTGLFAPLPFFCIFACGLQWCLYGTFAFLVTGNYGFLILVYSNCLGVVMGAYYVYTYFSNCFEDSRINQCKVCFVGACMTFGFQACIIPTMPHTTALLIVGTIAAGKSVLVTAAPFADVKKIFQEHDVSSMPKDVVLASFIASVLWFGCAILLHDTWILVPNFAGVVIGSIQLFFLAQYGDLIWSKLEGESLKKKKPFTYGALSDTKGCGPLSPLVRGPLLGSDCEGPGGTAD